MKDHDRVLHASLRKSTWRAFSRCHYSSHTVISIIPSYCLAPFIQKYNRMNVGSDGIHFTQKEEGGVEVIHNIGK